MIWAMVRETPLALLQKRCPQALRTPVGACVAVWLAADPYERPITRDELICCDRTCDRTWHATH